MECTFLSVSLPQKEVISGQDDGTGETMRHLIFAAALMTGLIWSGSAIHLRLALPRLEIGDGTFGCGEIDLNERAFCDTICGNELS